MGKLHKKMVELGDMTAHSYDSVVAACGEPKEKKHVTFSDIGEGTRATWTDGFFSITFNFNQDGKYCGIYDHKNLQPYIVLLAVTVVLVAAALIIGAQMRKGANAGAFKDEAGLEAAVTAGESVWKTENTAGLSLYDLDGDKTPELLAVDTRFGYDNSLQTEYFSDTAFRIYRLSSDGAVPAGEFSAADYCYAASLYLNKNSNGESLWSFENGDDGEQWVLIEQEGAFTSARAEAMLGGYENAGEYPLMRNESWLKTSGETAGDETVAADISAVCRAWFEQ